MTNLETIRAACIKANPEIEAKEHCACGHELTYDKGFHRPIRLADVLLAIWKIRPGSYFVDVRGQFWFWSNIDKPLHNVPCAWKLSKDNVAEQSEETIVFLADLLK